MGGAAVTIRPLIWMRALRDDSRCTATRLTVLCMLALRMRADGTGYASAQKLADDSRVNERTARRAVEWARWESYLNRTRRGHRLGNGQTVASEYALTLPVDNSSQPDTGDQLKDTSTGHTDGLNRTQQEPQPDTGVRPRGSPQEVNHQEGNGAVRDETAAAVASALRETRDKEVSDDWMRKVVRQLTEQFGADHPPTYFYRVVASRPDDFLPTPQPPNFRDVFGDLNIPPDEGSDAA